MNTKSYIELKIEGKKGGVNLNPDNLDISDIREVLLDIEALLFPYTKERKSEVIAYRLEEGSVIHKFLVPIALAISFQGIIDLLQKKIDLNTLEEKQVEILAKYQEKAIKEDLHFSFRTSEKPTQIFKIHKNTQFVPRADIWVDTEQYIYGEVFEAGGKEKSNIHLNTSEFGTLIIKATKEQAKNAGHLLYQEISLFIKAKQNLETGKLTNVELISFDEFKPTYDETYLNEIIERVSPHWKSISIDNWLDEIRGKNNA